MSNPKKMDIREKIALAVSVAIVIAALVYWTVQISGVMEMLEMAGG